MLKGKKFTQLNAEERAKIEVLLQQGLSYSAIARVLGRSVSTVSREVSRNRSVRGKRPVYYSCRLAVQKTLIRHKTKRKRVVLDAAMIARITHWLTNERFSPELISVLGRAEREDFISHEWIYQWIWRMKYSYRIADRPLQKLYRYLRHGRGRCRRGNRRTKRGNIIKRVWIDQRPKIVERRKRKGDMEADIILGLNRQPGLLVVLDRKSRKIWLRKLPTKASAYVIKQVEKICSEAGEVKTITFDNDQSFAEHYRLTEKLGTSTYFTHPYSSQEKGSVENRIGIIRMFFNKKTDFTTVTKAQVKSVENKINNRPLRLFNYKSPNEIHIS